MIRFATIGSNFIVDQMLEAASHCADFAHGAVYSRTEERARAFAEKWGVQKTYTSLQALKEDSNIDAVYIASPNLCHKEQALLFLNAGKHVLCEKPMAVCENDFEEMISAAKRNRVVLMEAMRPAHSPGLAMVKALLPKIGKVRRATLQFCQYSSRYDKFRNGIVENAFNPTLANGALMDIGIYCVHAMEILFGMPRTLFGASVFLRTGVDGEGTILAGYDDKICELIYSKITQAQTPSQIQGEDGAILLDGVSVPKGVTLIPRGGEKQVFHVEMNAGGDMTYEINDFIRQAKKGEMDESFIEHSRNAIRITDKARSLMGVDFKGKY